ISEKVSLSKKGKSYFGLCPFHNEKTPSFSVEPERKIYTCFSCGEKGNAITFKQKTENLTFVEAVEDLAIKANIDLDFGTYKRENPHKKYFEINRDAENLYKLYLSSTKQGIIAKQYLVDRGIKDDVINAFNIGLSPTEFDVLYKTLTEKGILVSDLHDLGLVKQSKTKSFYDLFRERIIFPILDERGNTVGFSGRSYLQTDKDSPKYINSPQTVVFTKSRVVYNLSNAINEIKKNNRVVLFEGYMDVIAAYRANIKESVASMGTSLTTEQVKIMKKYTSNVTICYDGDSAGIEATTRAIKLFERENMQVKIVLLPDNLDPDDYLSKYSAEKLNSFINEKWMDKIEFSYIQNNMGIDHAKMIDIERFKKTIFDLIKNTSNTIIERYIKRLATDISVSVESVRQDFNQYTRKNIHVAGDRFKRAIPIDSKYLFAERRLLCYFLSDIKYVLKFNAEFGEIFYINSMTRDIKHLIEDTHYKNLEDNKNSDISEDELVNILNEEQLHFYNTKVKNKMIMLFDKEYEDLIGTIQDYLNFLIQTELEEKIRAAETATEKIELAKYRDTNFKEAKHGQR
ncbi:MAG: DNA primase, partial [Candidatus Izimaplasma sp.]|nr:DNA primase [Candidatus Izimaplasma bacterium]